MGIRDRKQRLIGLMKIRAKAHKLSDGQVSAFELMFRQSRNEAEQDQVMQAFDDMLDGWQKNQDAFARIRRDWLEDELEDPEPEIRVVRP